MNFADPNAWAVFAEDNRWLLLWPELTVALLALAVLVLDLLGGFTRARLQGIVMTVLAIATVLVLFTPVQDPQIAFSGLVRVDALTDWMRAFFLAAAFLVCATATPMFQAARVPKTEYLHILLVVTMGLMLLGVANHFVLLFIALETLTVGLFVLIGYTRHEPVSLEASLKYLVLGSFSSGLLLFGLVLVYGASSAPGSSSAILDPMAFSDLTGFFAIRPDDPLGLTGALLVVAGILFKLGVFPFQIWIPDVYQGAPVPTTAFLSVASKAAGLFVLLNLLQGPFAPMSDLLVPILGAVAVASILFGNLAALVQRNVKRLIGLSGISHAGYLLLGLIAASTIDWAISAVLFYLVAYLLASFAVLVAVAHLGEGEATSATLDDYAELAKRSPFLGAVFAIGIGSLAGIPPLAGFIGKLLIFVALYQAGHYVLLGFAVAGVVISIYYYFGWIMSVALRVHPAVFSPDPADSSPSTPIPAIGFTSGVVMLVLSALTILGGVAQGIITAFLP